MKLHGYCTRCRRVKRVNAGAHALVMATARGGGVVQGVCDQCEEDARPRCGIEFEDGRFGLQLCDLVRGHRGRPGEHGSTPEGRAARARGRRH